MEEQMKKGKNILEQKAVESKVFQTKQMVQLMSTEFWY